MKGYKIALILLCTAVVVSFTQVENLWSLDKLSRIEIKSRVEVDRNEVYLADLISDRSVPFKWKQKFASIYIGEAPAPGTIKYVQIELLKDFIKKILNSEGVDTREITVTLPDEVVVTRKTVNIPKTEIEQAFIKHVMKNSPWNPEDITITNIRYSGLPVVPAGSRSYEIIPDDHELYLGNVAVSMNVYIDGKRVRTLRVAGIVSLYKDVVHAKKLIGKNQIVTPDDIELKRLRITSKPSEYAESGDLVVGKRTLREIYPGEPVKLSYLDNPIVVEKGDVVKIVLRKPGLVVTAKGIVKESGHIGDTIRVMNINSKKVIFCKVKSKETVQVID